MDEYVPCFACGAKSLNLEGERHEYMLSSPGCWAMFCEVVARGFSDLRCWKGHQFVVDAYAAQHVGIKDDNRAVNSVNIHLAALHSIFEDGIDVQETPKYREQFSQFHKGSGLLTWLEPPESFGGLTVYDIWHQRDPESHFENAKAWAKSVWASWSHQHKRIAELVAGVRGG